jgi:hypothetical protein
MKSQLGPMDFLKKSYSRQMILLYAYNLYCIKKPPTDRTYLRALHFFFMVADLVLVDRTVTTKTLSQNSHSH